MKILTYKIIALLCIILTTLPVSTVQGRTDDPYKKESKKVAKTLKEEGWKVFGGNRSIREAMDEHYKALGESNGQLTPIETRAKAKDINLAVRKSQNYAAQRYAALCETQVEGTTETQINNSAGSEASTQVDFSANFKSSMAQKVKSLKPTVVFFRTLENDWVEVRAFYLVDIFK